MVNSKELHVIASFTLVPVSAGLSLSSYIAECKRIVQASGLVAQFHSNGTNIEGSWPQVFKTIEACQLKVHEMGCERIFTAIQLGTRTDKKQAMLNKQKSVDQKLTR